MKKITGIALVAVAALSFASSAMFAPKAVRAAVAALVRDEDNPARHPFVTQCQAAFTTTRNTSCNTAPIPAGEEVVIETVSLLSLADPTNHALEAQVFTKTAGTSFDTYLNVITDSGTGQPTFATFQGGQSFRLYADPGTVIGCSAITNGPSPSQSFGLQCYFSGYYVTLP